MAERVCRELLGRPTAHVARSVGTGPAAARRLTTREVAWADVIAVMERRHVAEIARDWPDHLRKVRVLGVPDDYDPEEEALRALLADRIGALLRQLGLLAAERPRA